LPTAALRSASLRSASLRCAAAGKTGGEAGEAEDIPLFFTWIPILALLSNYDQEICLIHVGTEGLFNLGIAPTFDLAPSGQRFAVLMQFGGGQPRAIQNALQAMSR